MRALHSSDPQTVGAVHPYVRWIESETLLHAVDVCRYLGTSSCASGGNCDMVKECEKVFRGYHPELHAQPLADASEQRRSAVEPHADLPLVLEQHYNDVKGVEHQRLAEQRKLSAELRSFEHELGRAAQERSELRQQLPQISSHLFRVEGALRALEQLSVATSTLQLQGSTPATHSAVLAARFGVIGSNATTDSALQGEAPITLDRPAAGPSLLLWRPFFVSPAVFLAIVWLVTAAGGIESQLFGFALVPVAIGSLLTHVFGTLESAQVRWLWAHFVILMYPWLGSWTIRRFVVGDWPFAMFLSLIVVPVTSFAFTRLLRLRERLRVKQRLELGRLAPSLFVVSLSVAATELYLAIGGLGCALADHPSIEIKTDECAGRIFGQAILAFHILLVYMLWVTSLNQVHRSAFLRLELTTRQLLDADLNPEEVKMLVLLLLSSVVALLLQQMAAVAPASLWPSDIIAQPPLLGAALMTAYAVVSSALAVVTVLESTRPPVISPMAYDTKNACSHTQHTSDAVERPQATAACNTVDQRRLSISNDGAVPAVTIENGASRLHSGAQIDNIDSPQKASQESQNEQRVTNVDQHCEAFSTRSTQSEGRHVISGRNFERLDRGPSHPEQIQQGGFLSKAQARRHVGMHSV